MTGTTMNYVQKMDPQFVILREGCGAYALLRGGGTPYFEKVDSRWEVLPETCERQLGFISSWLAEALIGFALDPFDYAVIIVAHEQEIAFSWGTLANDDDGSSWWMKKGEE